MDKLKNLPPAVTSLTAGVAGAALYALKNMLDSGQELTTPAIVQTVTAAIVAYLISYGLGLYHLVQSAPAAAPVAVPVPVAESTEAPKAGE